MKCDTCKVQRYIAESKELACCAWYMENVVCGDKSVEDCPVREEDEDDE